MFKNYKTIIVIVLSLIMVSTATDAAVSSSHVHYSHASANVNFAYENVAEFYIINNLSVPTPHGFVEHIMVNSFTYSAYENPNLSNIFFATFSGTVIPSWLQSGNSYTDNNTSYWLKINTSIPAHGTMAIYMDAATTGTNILNNYSIGEAPQLTNVYGIYDDGSHIFNFYDNFAGARLNTSKWLPLNSNYHVNNGISFTSAGSYLTSRIQFGHPAFVEAYGIMNTPAVNNSTSYDLGGVGFGNGGMDYTAPVVTAGWTEGYTNGPGLTLYNGTGPFYYNYSRSVNMSNYHLFGLGFINDSYTVGTVDSMYQNSSNFRYGISSTQMLNITLGFQTNDFPKINNFRYVFEYNSTSKGINLPYTFKSYNVIFHETGLPKDSLWARNVNNLVNFPENNGYFLTAYANISLPDGHYNYTVMSGTAGYTATNNSGSFIVNGQSVTVNVTFRLKDYNVTIIPVGLPPGSLWSFKFYSGIYYSSASYANLSLPNGTYQLNISTTPDGYVPLPNYITFGVHASSTAVYIRYESPLNVSYADPIMSFNPSLREEYKGYNLMPGGQLSTTSIATDTQSNVLFTVVMQTGNIIPYNITTGEYLPNITLGASSGPFFAYYDAANGLLYVSNTNTGNLTIVNPSTMSIIKNITLTALKSSPFVITQSPQSNLIYAMGYSSKNQSNVTVYTLEPSGTILKEYNYSNLSAYFYIPNGAVSVSTPVYGQNIYLANGSGVNVLNLSNGAESYYPSPSKYYYTAQLLPYGNTGNFIVSNGNNNSTLLFSARNMTYFPGPDIQGLAVSEVYDPLNGYLYLSTVSNGPPYSGNLTVVSLSNNSVLSNIYMSLYSTSMALSIKNRSIFALDEFSTDNIIHSYSVPETFNISFEESGLPSGVLWYVNISGQPSSGPLQSGSVYTVTLNNGSYSYTVGTNDKIYRSSTGSFTANSAKTIDIEFFPVEYDVSITEKGLPTGTEWSVNLNGTVYTYAKNTISAMLVNGTYSYSVNSISGYMIANKTGLILVRGASVDQDVIFLVRTYNVTIRESGLALNTTWAVTVDGITYNVTGTEIVLSLANGTYNYTVKSIGGYSLNNGSGNFTVNGLPTSLNIKYSPVSSNSYILYIVIAVIVVAAIASLALFMRKKKEGGT